MSDPLVRVELGPTGPRAVVRGGTPVWEVIDACRGHAGGSVADVAAGLGLSCEQVEAALAWYRTHRAEVERDRAASSADVQQAWRSMRRPPPG